jgi:hypothetical protein
MPGIGVRSVLRTDIFLTVMDGQYRHAISNAFETFVLNFVQHSGGISSAYECTSALYIYLGVGTGGTS